MYVLSASFIHVYSSCDDTNFVPFVYLFIYPLCFVAIVCMAYVHCRIFLLWFLFSPRCLSHFNSISLFFLSYVHCISLTIVSLPTVSIFLYVWSMYALLVVRGLKGFNIFSFSFVSFVLLDDNKGKIVEIFLSCLPDFFVA